MEDNLLMDAAERFVRGEMSTEEKTYFEELRKNNPALDRAVAEQILFLKELDRYAGEKRLRGSMAGVEQKLLAEKFMSRDAPPRGRLVTLWTRYRKTIAVAASIAGLVSLIIATAVSTATTNKDRNINQLIGKVDAQEMKTRHLENQISLIAAQTNVPVKPSLESNFRATGFMIDVAGNYLVTNAHVVQKFAHRLVVENNRGDQFDASAVFVDDSKDIAILKITDTSFKRLGPLPYTIRKGGAELGESIFMLGYPKPEIVYGEGYVSARNGYMMDTVFCQINTAANEGNSGSPVISRSGDVVGIVTSTQTDATGVVFAVKSANIFRAAEALKKDGADTVRIGSQPAVKLPDHTRQIKKIEDYIFMIKGN